MTDNCPRCNEFRSKGSQFCGACGQRIPKRNFLDFGNNPLFVGAFFTALLGVLILLVEVICLLLSSVEVLDILDWAHINLVLITPKVISFYTLEGIALKLYWVIIILAILASAVYSIIKFIGALRASNSDGDKGHVENTGLFWAGVLFCATVTFTLAYNLLLMAFGTQIDASWINEYTDTEMKFLLAEAPFWEEIVGRVLLVGVPMTVIALVVTKKANSLKCLLGGFGMSKVAIIFILFSGLMFGFAHDGWGWEKIPDAAVAGFAMAYLYVRFGLYASIIMHFLTDYLSSFAWLGSPESEAIITLFILGLGLVSLVYLAPKIFRRDAIKTLPLFSSWPDKKESGK
jgi:hypothetical protein